MNQKLKYLLIVSLFLAVFADGRRLDAIDAKSSPPVPPAGNSANAAAKAKRDWYPFGGIVAAVDSQANTISLKKKEGTRVLRLDANSKLEIGGRPAAIGSVKAGTYAHGKLHKNPAGKEVISAAKFDPEAPVKPKPTGASKEPAKTPATQAKP